MRVFLVVLCFIYFTSFAVMGQQASAELLKLNDEYTAKYRAGEYSEALVVLDKMLAATDFTSIPGALGALFYNRACLEALTGKRREAIATIRLALESGCTKYASYATDRDLDSLRADADFKTLLAEIREKWGTKPLQWDAAEARLNFRLKFDAPDTPELNQLRNEFSLGRVLSGAGTDYEKLIRLASWTSQQWQHDSSHMASKSDPLTILREAKAGGRFICQNYAVVLAGVTRAYGFYPRLLGLLPKDVETRSEAHSVVEVWLPKFQKWVIADAQYGIVPEIAGVPLNALELQKAIADEAGIECRGNSDACSEWKAFILPNIFYLKIAEGQNRFGMKAGERQLVLVPKDAAQPRKFAGGHEEVFAGSIYTSNPANFYAPPE